MQIIVSSRTVRTLALFIAANCTCYLFGQYPGPAETAGTWLFAGSGVNNAPASPRGAVTPFEYSTHGENNSDTLLFPPPQKDPPPSGRISVAELQHPLSRKGKRLMLQAQKHLEEHKTTEALADLGKALQEPSAVPYAHSMLGATYLWLGRVSEAIPELQQAVQMLPTATNYSNLGYAHCIVGDRAEGERELQRALELDSASARTHYLIGVLLLDNKDRNHEACAQLERAESALRSAHMALAVCYVRAGQDAAVDRQIKEYAGAADDTGIAFWTHWAYLVASQAKPSTAFGFHE
jgi:tetratricopeptide (TPR) repeat protein